jgi:hypothetical protein
MKQGVRTAIIAAVCIMTVAVPAVAHAPSGAIFTTLADGSEVNLNHFPSKEAVYLDGGPGPGAPQTAAGLDDGTYVFQVTDPSGKVLLSTDAGKCRQFTVASGIITSVVATGCQHVTGNDNDHPPAKTVRLFPYLNTPNNGGVYKAWVTRIDDFLLGCSELGVANGLDVVDCGAKTQGNAHGFIPSHSKTDNFKVKNFRLIREIDVIYYRDSNHDSSYGWGVETQLSGLPAIWTDTLGVQNTKYSYFLPMWNLTEAHVEAVEEGIHFMTIPDLSAMGCVVGEIYVGDVNHYLPTSGPQTILVDMSNLSKSDKDVSIQIWVACN